MKSKRTSRFIAVMAVTGIAMALFLAGCETGGSQKTIDHIEITSPPDNTQYVIGDPLELTGLELTVYYTDSTSETVTVTADNITGFDTAAAGTKTLTITYEGMTATFDITVIKPAQSIEFKDEPTDLKCAAGETLDLAGLELSVSYEDGTTETVTITMENIKGFDNTQTGEQTVTISYGGKEVTFTVTVVGVSKIEVTSPPDKTKYAIGEELDLEGLEVTATYSDNTSDTVEITMERISGFDSSEAEDKQTVTITYSGQTATFTVTVVGVEKIEVTKRPNKTEFAISEPLDITGLEITATYSDGDTAIVTGITSADISGFDSAATGEKTLTVSWGGKETTFTVTVADIPLTVQGSTLAEKLQWVRNNAQSNTTYILEVSADESLAAQSLNYSGKTDITVTLQGIDGEKTVSLSGTLSLFTVASGVTLVLEKNITLRGRSDNNNSLVTVNSGGELVMNTGSKITGNTFSSSYIGVSGYSRGGGVSVFGTFTMHGGEISGNRASTTGWDNNNDTNSYGGGVYVGTNGTFTMHDGKISGNGASSGYSSSNYYYYNSYGGGVYVSSNATFIMEGGTISGNTSSATTGYHESYGGGVCVDTNGTFAMHDGVISGNTAESGGGGVSVGGTFTMHGGEISGNTANSTSTGGGGGGVFVDTNGTFAMNDGVISGNTNTGNTSTAGYGGGVYVGGTFTMHGGEISGNTASNGGGVFVRRTNGTFTMHDGVISGNTASSNGGGVSVNLGTFIMHDGVISGNTASSYGGGVDVFNHPGTTFRIVTGTIYGSGEAEGIGNTASSSAALEVSGQGSAQYGTFSGDEWNSNGNLARTDNTIRVEDGERIQ